MRALISVLVLCQCVALSLQVTCGTTGKSCISGRSVCDGTTCSCVSPRINGDPFFTCYKPSQVAAEIKNDPTLTNFNNETIKFQYPCRYLITHIKQNLLNKEGEVIGKCEIQAHGFNAKHKGKFYAYGFDVAVRINYTSGPLVELSGRRYGTASNGVTSFTLKGTYGVYDINGPFGNDNIDYIDDVNGVKVKTFEKPENNELIFEFKKCGFEAIFKPYDLVLTKTSIFIPGISMAVNCANKPKFCNHSRVLATAPVMGGGVLFSSDDYKLPYLNAVQTNFVRANLGNVLQTQPSASSECTDGQSIWAGCSDANRKKAFDSCYWMLIQPKFVKCIDDSTNANKIMNLYNKCVDGWCSDSGKCDDAIAEIVAKPNCASLPDIDQLSGFLLGNNCPS